MSYRRGDAVRRPVFVVVVVKDAGHPPGDPYEDKVLNRRGDAVRRPVFVVVLKDAGHPPGDPYEDKI